MNKLPIYFRIILIVFLFLLSTRSFAQNPKNLIGSWSGKFNIESKHSVVGDYTMEVERVAGEDLIIDVKYQNRSDGKKDSHDRIKAHYKYMEGQDVVWYDTTAYIKGTNKICRGSLVFIVKVTREKRRVMTARFFARNESEIPGYMGGYLVSLRDVEQLYVNNSTNTAETANAGTSTSVRKVIHFGKDPVVFDGDTFFNFSEGYAVVTKGRAFCLIDQNGKVAIPYNKYNFAFNALTNFSGDVVKNGRQHDTYGFVSGFLSVQDPATKLWGVMDKNLKLIIPCKHTDVRNLNKDGYFDAYVTASKSGVETHMIYDRYGKVIERGKDKTEPIEYSVKVINNLPEFGYIDMFGDFKFKGKFEQAMKFSDGMAAVAQKDEFGVLKWGYINTKGKLVIPYMFSIKPRDFHEGRALVEPAIKTDFNYAYIDKSGKIVMAFKEDKDCSVRIGFIVPVANNYAVREKGVFMDGYSLWHITCKSDGYKNGFTLVDTLGNRTNLMDGLKKNGWKPATFRIQSEFQNGEIIITSKEGVKSDEITAIANYKGEILLATAFEEESVLGTIYSTFDPISGLVRFMTYKVNGKTINGYCDRNGEIKIILGEPAKW